jgi:PPOX class probable F420-dependent enzyme
VSAEYSPEQRRYLDDHVWAVLATGRADGSPQQSMVGYVVDAEGRLVVSAKRYTAKWRNAVRNPKVSVTVPDGRAHLVIYGTAEAIETDPLRAELTADVFARVANADRPDPASLIPTLDEQQRTVIRVSPEKVLFVD